MSLHVIAIESRELWDVAEAELVRDGVQERLVGDGTQQLLMMDAGSQEHHLHVRSCGSPLVGLQRRSNLVSALLLALVP